MVSNHASYRKGLTLGLTMAEIFILLFFLLLLLLLAFHVLNLQAEAARGTLSEEVARKRGELQTSERERSLLSEQLAEGRSELQTSQSERETERAALLDEIQELMLRNNELGKKLELARQDHSLAKLLLAETALAHEGELTALREEQEQSLVALAEEQEKDLGKLEIEHGQRLTALARKHANTLLELEKAQRENLAALESQQEETLTELESSREQTLANLETARHRNEQLRARLYSRKGVDPPCWYEITQRDGLSHERPLYLLDVAVHDEHVRVRLRDPPLGKAIDENGQGASTSYREEHDRLPFAALGVERDMSLQEFSAFAAPVWKLGKDTKIRDYSCVFHAKVWDLTNPTAKNRWQQAEDSIKQWFYTYRVRNDPWETSSDAPR